MRFHKYKPEYALELMRIALADFHDIPTLNIYAEQRRYEEGPVEATEEDAKFAKDLVQAVLNWAANIIGKNSSSK